MKSWQRIVKHLAIALAIILACAIIFGIVGVFAMIFGINDDDNIMDQAVEISISQSISSVDISIGAAEFKMFGGDRFGLYTNIKNLRVSEDNGVLRIEQRQKRIGIHTNKTGTILLMIPKDHTFKDFDIESGAGLIEMESLVAESIEFGFGAGSVDIDRIVASRSASIDAGAGKLNIGSGVLNNLDLDLGVGKTTIKAQISGESSIDCGVGSTCLYLVGSADDYCIDTDTGIGSVSVDGTSIKGSSVIGNGINRISIDGGVGNVEINFTNE